jgi:transcription initiation factor TFIIB
MKTSTLHSISSDTSYNNSSRDTHNDHGILIVDRESGEIICSSCGQVLTHEIQKSHAQWLTSFASENNNPSSDSVRATGMPVSLARHDMGLATLIGKIDRDASGRALDTTMRSTMERLRILDFRTQLHNSGDRSLRQAFSQLDNLKTKLGLSDAIVEKTAYIYRKAQERGFVRGRTISATLAAAAYIACRELGIPRTLSDISMICNIKQKELARNYRMLVFELDYKVPLVDLVKCIAKVANKASLSEKIKHKASSIMYEVTKNEISAGKDPMGLAAAVLYLASLHTEGGGGGAADDQHKTQKHIAEAAAISAVTLRARYRDLNSKLEEEKDEHHLDRIFN